MSTYFSKGNKNYCNYSKWNKTNLTKANHSKMWNMSIKLSSFPSVILFWYCSYSSWRFGKITKIWNVKGFRKLLYNQEEKSKNTTTEKRMRFINGNKWNELIWLTSTDYLEWHNYLGTDKRSFNKKLCFTQPHWVNIQIPSDQLAVLLRDYRTATNTFLHCTEVGQEATKMSSCLSERLYMQVNTDGISTEILHTLCHDRFHKNALLTWKIFLSRGKEQYNLLVNDILNEETRQVMKYILFG